MLQAHEVQAFLRQFEPLKHVEVDQVSDLIDIPYLVRVHGLVMIYGEGHAFEAELDLREFGNSEDLIKLAQQLLKSFAVASRSVAALG